MYSAILKSSNRDPKYIIREGNFLKNSDELREHQLLLKSDNTPLASVVSHKYEGTLPDGSKHIIWRRDDSRDGGTRTILEKGVDARNLSEFPMHQDVSTYTLVAKNKPKGFATILKFGTVAGAEKRWAGHVPKILESQGRLTAEDDIAEAGEVLGDRLLNKSGVRKIHPLIPKALTDAKVHLANAGYAISDLHSGIVKDKYGREMKAGKALSQSKASKELMEAYALHQQGSNLDLDAHHIITSTKPLDIAGMTTATSWADSSCMDLHKGSNKHYLEQDVRHGTRVHFLTHKDDPNIENPLARALSKKYVGKLPDGTEHVIYRRDDKVYGSSNTAFNDSIDAMNEKNHPMHPDVSKYVLHGDLYLNQGRDTLHNFPAIAKHIDDPTLTQEQLKVLVEHPDKEIGLKLLKRSEMNGDLLKRLAAHPNDEVVMGAMNHEKVNKDVINVASMSNNIKVALAALAHPLASNTTCNNAAGENSNLDVARFAMNHKEADSETIESAVGNSNPKVVLEALKHPSVTKRAVTLALNSEDKAVGLAAVRHNLISASGLDAAMKNIHSEVVSTALDNPGITTMHTIFAASNKDKDVALKALHHDKADDNTVTAAATNMNQEVAMAALRNQKATKITVDSAAGHKDSDVVIAALNHKHTTKNTLDVASNNPDKKVGLELLKAKDLPQDILGKLSNHPDKDVAITAINDPRSTAWSIAEGLRHTDADVRTAVMKHPLAEGDILSYGARDRNKNTALAALNHHNTDRKVLRSALNNSNPEVLSAVLQHPLASDDIKAKASELLKSPSKIRSSPGVYRL